MRKQINRTIDVEGNGANENACSVSLRFLKIASKHVDIASLLNALVLEVQRLSGCSAVGLRLLEEDGSISFKSHSGFKEDVSKSKSHISIELDECVCTDVIKGTADSSLSYFTEQGSFLTNSASALLNEISDEEKGKIYGACNILGYESALLVPVSDENGIFGLLHMADSREDIFQPAIVDTMEAAGLEIGLAIQRLRLFEGLQRSHKKSRTQYKEVTALLESAKVVLEYQDFEEAAQVIYNLCKNLISATTGYVAIKGADGKENKSVVLDIGDYACNVDPNLPIPIQGLCERTYSSGKPVYENDFAKSEWARHFPAGHFKLENIMFAPILFNDEAVGLISLANKKGGFTSNDIRISLAFAEILAIALHNDMITESLKDKEERFRSITKSASDAIVTADCDGKVTDWNDAASRIFGYSATSIIGKPLDTLIPKRFRKDHSSGFSKFIMTVKSPISGDTVELTGLKQNGCEFPLEMSLSTWNSNGKLYSTGIIRDITERKRADEEIQSMAKFSAENPFPVMRIASNGTILFANEAARLLLSDWKCDVGKVLPNYWKKLAIELLSRGTVKKGIEMYHKDLTFSFTGVPLPEEGYVNFYGVDDTERKRAEEAEERLRDRQSSILNSIDDAFIAFDNDFRYIYVNEKAEQVLGKSRDELIGEVFWEVFPEFARSPEAKNFFLAKEKQIPTSYEMKYDPFRAWFDLRIYPHANGLSVYFRDITKAKREKELSDSLNRINYEISSTLDFEKIIEGVVSEAGKAIGCDKSVIYYHENDYWVPRHPFNFPPELLGSSFSDEEAPCVAYATKKRKSVMCFSGECGAGCESGECCDSQGCHLASDIKVKSILTVPLYAKGETLGCILFAYDLLEADFSKAEVGFAEKLAVSISLAIENARLYAKEHKIAEVLQRSQLKLPEHIDGIMLTNIYRSATAEESEVGGDFYDIYELDKNNIAIAVGDVSGKGLEAAELTSVVKNCIRGFAYQGLSPSEVLEKTNLVVTKTAPSLSYVTVFFAILEKSSGLLRYCSAGHLPPIIKKKTSSFEILDARNTALGVFEDLRYEGEQLMLDDGDNLIVYTDGITEARRDLEFYGEERLMKSIKNIKQEDTTKIAKIIYDDVASFSNNIFADDIAILTISLDSTKDKI